MRSWKLYYENGETFSNLDGEPKDSPKWGAVCVCQPGLSGYDLVWGRDYLLFREDLDQWIGTDLVGFVDQQVTYGHHITAVRPGREMVSEEMKALVARAGKEMRGR